MKRTLPIIFAAALSLLFLACQKKQYAYVQQGKADTYTYTKTTKSYTPALEQTSALPAARVVDNEEIITSVTNPTETLAASNEVTVPASQSIATATAEVLNYNDKSIDAEFEKLNKLEAFVNANEGTTFEDVKETELVKDLNLDTKATTSLAVDDLPLNIPAFWWGCVLGLIGVLLVYIITDKDKAQTKMALYGCLTWTALWIVYWVVIAAAAAN
ncbi:hypothetical protein [Emticicia sp. TH156]|uniref:hypothetical protein n=1 Tax=Emticicia sp. TH156 TaxID=2067454 RepID=UPI000C7798B4|nr:hypothetical protein [Emticicia sp. TH156]PLK46192.1 hypothetical protein C0V77_02255 [Emticicia sp. TH156]